MAETRIQLDEELVGGDGEAELTDWLVDDGAPVEDGQTVAELSTSKAIVDVPSPAAGRLRRLVDVGAIVAVGEAIAVIEG